MRKTDKASRTNKPPKISVNGGSIGTLKQSKEELENAKKVVKTAQKMSKNKKIIKLPSGFSYDFLKLKAEVTARKNKKNNLAD